MNHKSEDKFLFHAPCESCGSRDNLAVYENHTYCFGCQQHKMNDGEVQQIKKEKTFKDMITGQIEPLIKRNINEETCRVFNYE